MAGLNGARPTGVTILAVLAFVGGIFGILGSFAIVFGGAIVSTVFGGLGAIFVLLGLIVLALSIVELVLGYGFWMLRSWAWQLGFTLMAANVIVSLLEVVFGGGYGITNLLISIVIAGIIAYYLDTAEVRRAFGAPETGFPIVRNSLDQYLPNRRRGA